MTFDPNKPYTRRDGGEAVILFTKEEGTFWVIHYPNTNKEWVGQHHVDGESFSTTKEYDLINVPEEMYVNVYEAADGQRRTSIFAYSTEAKAKNYIDALGYIGTYKLVKVGE